jgi:4a-hydroxytetrahydrobiopterin dehydratase
VSRLTDEQVEQALRELEGWCREGDSAVKSFLLATFPEAVAFALRVAFAAEAADHHPEITISYRRVRLAYTTHSEQGLTQKDIEGARSVDALLAS